MSHSGIPAGDKFDSSIEISFQYGIGILLFRRPVLNMVLRFGILTYVLTAAAPAAAPDRVLRSVFNTVLRSGREGRARDSLVMSFQLGAQNHRLNTKSNTESNISIKLHQPKSGIEHSIQYGIKSQYFNRICLLIEQ